MAGFYRQISTRFQKNYPQKSPTIKKKGAAQLLEALQEKL
jgi:hypothetical protein